MDVYLGTIMLWPVYNPTSGAPRVPRDWALCDGQIMQISANSALFSLLGTHWGGDGQTTFALPDLRGRVPVGLGTGTGLTPRELGKTYGELTATLGAANLPAHTHTMTADATVPSTGLTQAPAAGWTLGPTAAATNPVQAYTSTAPATPVQSAPSSAAGNTNPAAFSTAPPSLGLYFIICTMGLYPTHP